MTWLINPSMDIHLYSIYRIAESEANEILKTRTEQKKFHLSFKFYLLSFLTFSSYSSHVVYPV